jgi:hypothetical protein
LIPFTFQRAADDTAPAANGEENKEQDSTIDEDDPWLEEALADMDS